jgi:hypothetical protein
MISPSVNDELLLCGYEVVQMHLIYVLSFVSVADTTSPALVRFVATKMATYYANQAYEL